MLITTLSGNLLNYICNIMFVMFVMITTVFQPNVCIL